MAAKNFYTGRVFHPEPKVHQLEINHTPQPWQLHDAKLRERTHLHPLARRQAREERKKAEAIAKAA